MLARSLLLMNSGYFHLVARFVLVAISKELRIWQSSRVGNSSGNAVGIEDGLLPCWCQNAVLSVSGEARTTSDFSVQSLVQNNDSVVWVEIPLRGTHKQAPVQQCSKWLLAIDLLLPHWLGSETRNSVKPRRLLSFSPPTTVTLTVQIWRGQENCSLWFC